MSSRATDGSALATAWMSNEGEIAPIWLDICQLFRDYSRITRLKAWFIPSPIHEGGPLED
jgi:hypothetical protein